MKSEQTTIKLIEAARYQLRLWGILHWPCRTWAWCYLSKFNLRPAAADPAAASLCECLWLKRSLRDARRPDYHAAESPPAVGQMWTPRLGSVAPICSASFLPPQPNCSLILLLGQRAFNSMSFKVFIFNHVDAHLPTTNWCPCLSCLSGEPSRCNGTSKVSSHTHNVLTWNLNPMWIFLNY